MRDARLITRVDRLAEGDVTVVLEPLKFIKIIDRYEHRCRLPVLREHHTFMAAPGAVDQFGEMTARLRNRTRERHCSTVQLDADSCRVRRARSGSTPTRAAPGTRPGADHPFSAKAGVCKMRGRVAPGASRSRRGRAVRVGSTSIPGLVNDNLLGAVLAQLSGIGRDARWPVSTLNPRRRLAGQRCTEADVGLRGVSLSFAPWNMSALALAYGSELAGRWPFITNRQPQDGAKQPPSVRQWL